jgi:hypothetical protein
MVLFQCLYPTAAVENAMISFTCLPEAVPMVVSLFAANGYGVDIPAHKEVGGAITTLLTYGSATAVLISATSDAAMIGIWGIAQASAARLLRSLPFELQQRPCTYGDTDASTMPQPATPVRQTSACEHAWRSGGR